MRRSNRHCRIKITAIIRNCFRWQVLVSLVLGVLIVVTSLNAWAEYRWKALQSDWDESVPEIRDFPGPDGGGRHYDLFVSHPFDRWPPNQEITLQDFGIPHQGKEKALDFIDGVTGEIEADLIPENFTGLGFGMVDAALLRIYINLETGRSEAALEILEALAEGLCNNGFGFQWFDENRKFTYNSFGRQSYHHLLWHTFQSRKWSAEQLDSIAEILNEYPVAESNFRKLHYQLDRNLIYRGTFRQRALGLFRVVKDMRYADHPEYAEIQLAAIRRHTTPDFVYVNRGRKIFEKYLAKARANCQFEDFIRIACSVEKYYITNGRYPENIADFELALADRFQPAQEVVYERVGERYRLVSTGSDPEGWRVVWAFP